MYYIYIYTHIYIYTYYGERERERPYIIRKPLSAKPEALDVKTHVEPVEVCRSRGSTQTGIPVRLAAQSPSMFVYS